MNNHRKDIIYVIGYASSVSEQIRELFGKSDSTVMTFEDTESTLNATTEDNLPSLIVIVSDATGTDSNHAGDELDALRKSPLGHIPTLLSVYPEPGISTGMDAVPDMFRLLLDTIPDTVILHDGDGIITTVNTQCANTLSQPISTIIGKSIFDILHITSRKDFNRAMYKTRTTGTHSFSIPASFGGDRYVDVTVVQSAIPALDESLYISIVTSDTSSKDSELLNRFADKMRDVCDSAGATCHSLNQPLQAILGNSDLLMMDIDSNDRFYVPLEEMREQSKKMASLTKQLNQIIRQDLKSLIDDIG